MLLILQSTATLLFFPILAFSVYLSLSGGSILMLWVALELNMVSVLPLLSFESGTYGGEVSMKYFLVQAWGSALFLFGFLLGQSTDLGSYLVILSLIMKLGAAPLHLWFISVLRLSSLEVLVLLSTVQKVIPLLLLQQTGASPSLITLSVWASALVAGWGAFNHTGLRLVLAYSSIFTVAWCMSSFITASWLWLAYLGVYAVSLLVFVSACSTKSITSLSQLYLMTSVATGAVLLFLTLASMGGLPPLASFWVKMAVLETLLNSGEMFTSCLLLSGSVWMLYLYMRVAYFSSTHGSSGSPLLVNSGADSLAPQLSMVLGLPLFVLVMLVLLSGVIT